jgi:hypothetical protein
MGIVPANSLQYDSSNSKKARDHHSIKPTKDGGGIGLELGIKHEKR